MRPLVNYCRWQRATLRLRGRDDTSVWGELVYQPGTAEERAQVFHYDLRTRVITLEDEGGPPSGGVSRQLDEMGVVVG
jgi:hypothetical protein